MAGTSRPARGLPSLTTGRFAYWVGNSWRARPVASFSELRVHVRVSRSLQHGTCCLADRAGGGGGVGLLEDGAAGDQDVGSGRRCEWCGLRIGPAVDLELAGEPLLVDHLPG